MSQIIYEGKNHMNHPWIIQFSSFVDFNGSETQIIQFEWFRKPYISMEHSCFDESNLFVVWRRGTQHHDDEVREAQEPRKVVEMVLREVDGPGMLGMRMGRQGLYISKAVRHGKTWMWSWYLMIMIMI